MGVANLRPRSFANFSKSPPLWIHLRIAFLSSITFQNTDFFFLSSAVIVSPFFLSIRLQMYEESA